MRSALSHCGRRRAGAAAGLQFHRKIGFIGDEYIVEFAQHMDILRSTEPGVWIVRQNKIDLTVVQKPRTFDGGTVGNLDVDIRVALVNFA